VRPELRLQGDVETVGEEGDEEMRLDPLWTLMVDRPYREIVFQGLERRLDLDETQIVLPELSRVGGGQIRPQEVPALAPTDLPELGRVQRAYSGDLGRPVRRDDGPAFRRKPAGAERRWAFRYLSQAGGGVKATRVFRSEPPVSVS
jgi:hypothetical protein